MTAVSVVDQENRKRRMEYASAKKCGAMVSTTFSERTATDNTQRNKQSQLIDL